MNIKIFVIIIFFSIGSNAYAQSKNNVFSMGKFRQGNKVYLFADRVNVRSSPDIKKKNIIANLPIGYPLSIISSGESSYLLDNFKSRWYNVSFKNKEKEMTGYIWGGLISITSLSIGKGKERILFLFGIIGFDKKSNNFKGQARVVKNGKIISRTEFSPMYTPMSEANEYFYSLSSSLHDSRGLKNIKNLIMLEYLYEACGYTNGEHLFVFDGKNIFFCIAAPRVAEAGVFHFGSKLIFPNDSDGKEDKIIYQEVTEEYDEKINDYKVKSKKTKVYKWNGTKFVIDKKY